MCVKNIKNMQSYDYIFKICNHDNFLSRSTFLGYNKVCNQILSYNSVVQDQRKLTQYKKVVRGHEGRPSWKHLDEPSTLRKISE